MSCLVGPPCSRTLDAVGCLGEATLLRAACPAGLCAGQPGAGVGGGVPGHAALWGGGLSRQALQWVWLMLWQPGPELGLRGVAGTGESQPW